MILKIQCRCLISCLFGSLFFLQSFGQNTKLIIAPGTTLRLSSGTSLTLNNTDVTANGTIDALDGKVLLLGNSTTTFGGATTCTIGNFIINKPATTTLSGGISIAKNLIFQNGLIELNDNTINLLPGALLTAENETSHIKGASGGQVTTIARSINNPAMMNIGNLGASITSAANLGDVTVSRMHKPAVNPNSSILAGIERTFFIAPANNTSLNATLRFYYLDAELNGKSESILALWKSSDGIQWTLAGADTRDASNNYVEKTEITDFSYWTLSDASNPLPVKFISVKAICKGNDAIIEWQTGKEQNVADLIVQKSTDDGASWKDIGQETATNNASGNTYQYADHNPSAKAIYRIKSVDLDGQISYSIIFSGGCTEAAMPLIVYPNPATTNTTIRLSVRQAATAIIQIFNTAGQCVFSADWTVSIGINQRTIPMDRWAAGVYLLKVQLADGNVLQSKLTKQ